VDHLFRSFPLCHLALALALAAGGPLGCRRSEGAQLRARLTDEIQALAEAADAVSLSDARGVSQPHRSAPRVIASPAGLELWLAPWLSSHLPGPDAAPGTDAAFLAQPWRIPLTSAGDLARASTRLHQLTGEDLPGVTLLAERGTPLPVLLPLLTALQSGDLRRLWIATTSGDAVELAPPTRCHGAYDASRAERSCARATVRLSEAGPRLHAVPAHEDAERGCELGTLGALVGVAGGAPAAAEKKPAPPCVAATGGDLAGAVRALEQARWCAGSRIEAPPDTAVEELARLSAALRRALPRTSISWLQTAKADEGLCRETAEPTKVGP
jgi:hypothetical protein